MNKINKIAMLVGGILLVVLALLIKGTVANPLALLHTWGALDTMPPLWLVNLLWFGGYFVVGGAWFGVLCMPPCGGSREVLRYKGSMFLVLAVFFSFVWYLLLFGMQVMLLAWISMGIALFMMTVAIFCYFQTLPTAGWLLVLTTFFWIYLFLIHLMGMLHI